MTQEASSFTQRALRLLELGYRLVPIPHGSKGPVIDDWQKLEADAEAVKRWGEGRYKNGNIGIHTRYTPAIDLDITDESMAQAMEDWCVEHLGSAPVRVGKAPKRLLLFTTLRPFRKLAATAVDAFGDKHKVEILGDGQQFVAYGIHPDTQQPYRWTRNGEAADVAADFLPELSVEKAMAALEEFARLCRERGWEVKDTPTARLAVTNDEGSLDTFKPTLELSTEELVEALELVDGSEDYHRWVQVGMALHHQFGGSEEGLSLWDEWSSKAPNYSAEQVASKWGSFSQMPDGHVAVTAATILKYAHDAKAKKAQDEFSRAINMIRTCNNEAELFGRIAKNVSKALAFDFQFDIAAKAMQARAIEITGTPIRIETVRKALTPIKAVADRKKRPQWCEGWVYVESIDRFFNADSKAELSERSFNARYDREVLSSEDRATGKGIPETRAGALALNIYEIPTVNRKVYLPGFSKLVTINGERCVNIYDDSRLPPSEPPKNAEEQRALDAVKRHFDILFPDPRERHLVIDFLAYNVQFPSERINWAMVVQGVEGAGKTWMSELMGSLLGIKNVGPLTMHTLKSDFTGWAEGKKMIFVEEIRIHGQNRFEMIDKLKPFFTNSVVEIHRKGKDAYEIPNVTNYVMFTNHFDALPLNENDRRYFVVSTSFQAKADIDAFNKQNPSHFTDIFDALGAYPHVLRHWLMTWKLSAEFEPKRPAPMTGAKVMMREVSRSDEMDAINDILEGRHAPDLTEYVLNLSKLAEQAPLLAQVSLPNPRALRALLEQAGFVYVGRYRVGDSSERARIYTRHPRLFDGKTDKVTVYKAIMSGEPPEFML